MKLTVTSSPHIRGRDTIQRTMVDVLIALVPALIASTVVMGPRNLGVAVVSMSAAIAAEWLFSLACKKPNPVRDGSAAVTGLLLACRMRVGDPTCGANYGMDSIAATVIGGTSLAGGTGLLSGTVAGAFLIGMLSNVMNNLNVNQFFQYVMKGALLIAAMVIYSISDRLEVRRRES